jgi:hypothetical protein
MDEKIVHFGKGQVNHRALLHQVLERDGVDGVVLAVCVDGRWETCWGGDLDYGSLCMASMKLTRDVSDAIESSTKSLMPARPPSA